tara:strand:- start:347 stop:574 length:228 start_codon:yes stop_codon:yes gene_type:complete
MIRDKQVQTGPIVIDLTGPDGNAFSLMGSAMRLGKQLDLTKEQINLIITDMQSGDYENLIQVFDKHFGAFVILER